MIYVVNFKSEHFNPYLPPGYKNLNVGNICTYLNKDNIEQYNLYINELTALYYIWKNSDEEYVGLAHYRRFLRDSNADDIIDFDICKAYLEKYNIICTAHYVHKENLIDFLRYDFESCRMNVDMLNKYYNILIEYHPELKLYFETNCGFNGKHMFVCKKELIDKYCEWLFPIILPITEKFVKEDAYKLVGNDIRALGYIFERLLSYWLQINNFSILGLDVLEYKRWF